jgi:hypothetical protein
MTEFAFSIALVMTSPNASAMTGLLIGLMTIQVVDMII